MSVQTSAQSLLIQEMGDETNASTKHKETVEYAHLEVIFSLLSAKGSTVAKQIDKADSDTAINVQDQVILLRCSDCLNCNGIVEQLCRWELCLAIFLDESDSKIWVVARLDTMTNARNCVMLASISMTARAILTQLVLLSHGVDKVSWAKTLVVSPCELLSSAIKSTSESRADGQKTSDE